MRIPKELQEQYERAMILFARRLTTAHWERTRGITLGGAGLSTAILFLLTQIGIKSLALDVSFFCAALGIPVWLALWQVGEAYLFNGSSSHGHFAKLQGSGLGVLLFLFGGFLLLVSFVTLTWHFSKLASGAFLVASLAMVVFVYKHQTAVRIWAENNPTDEA
jgi:hypothetical protein